MIFGIILVMRLYLATFCFLLSLLGVVSSNRPLSVVTDDKGTFVCSMAVSRSGAWYTASHCAEGGKFYVDGKLVSHKDLKGDLVRLGNSEKRDDSVLPASRVKVGLRVVCRMGGFSSLGKPIYFDVEAKVLGVYRGSDLNYVFDSPDDEGRYALIDVGAFPGCSGSGVYHKGKLIGVIVGGLGQYSFVALFE